MRPLIIASAAVLAGIVSLFAVIVGPVSERGVGVRVAEARAAVTVGVRCESNPEITRVKNNTNRRIAIRTVGSIHQPRGNEPFRVDRVLRPGRAMAFQSGSGARRNVLTRQFIYDNEVGKREGARVRTSAGVSVRRCG